MNINKLLRAIGIGFFLISALYVAVKYETLYPLFGFIIFLLFVYIIGFFFKKERTAMEEGEVPLRSLSLKMILLAVVALIFIATSAVYMQEGLVINVETQDIILRYASFIAALIIVFFLLLKPLELDKPTYMFFWDKKGGIIRLIIIVSTGIALSILFYEGLRWLLT